MKLTGFSVKSSPAKVTFRPYIECSGRNAVCTIRRYSSMARRSLISRKKRTPAAAAPVDLEDGTPSARLPAATPELEPGAPSDLDLMRRIQMEEPDALALLYDRYNGILKALILRVIHNEAEADDLLQEIFMEIWNQARNFSA